MIRAGFQSEGHNRAPQLASPAGVSSLVLPPSTLLPAWSSGGCGAGCAPSAHVGAHRPTWLCLKTLVQDHSLHGCPDIARHVTVGPLNVICSVNPEGKAGFPSIFWDRVTGQVILMVCLAAMASHVLVACTCAQACRGERNSSEDAWLQPWSCQ